MRPNGETGTPSARAAQPMREHQRRMDDSLISATGR